jgi:glycerophosphoryl diester phosphodiesterase
MEFRRDIASKINITGHRGGGFEFENSIASFRIAIEKGLSEIEFDIYLTSDKVPVVLHGSEQHEIGFDWPDNTFTKNTLVDDMTLAQVKSITLPNEEKIPTLEEVLELWKDKIRLMLDIKSKNLEVIQIIFDMLKDKGYTKDSVNFVSFDHNLLKEIKKLDPEYLCGYLYEWYDEMDQEYYLNNGDTWNVPISHLTTELAENWKKKGLDIVVYFPREYPEDPKYYPFVLECGVKNLVSDKPLEFMEYLESVKTTEKSVSSITI